MRALTLVADRLLTVVNLPAPAATFEGVESRQACGTIVVQR